MQKYQDKVDRILNTGDTRTSLVYNLTMAFLVLVVCVNFVLETYSVSPVLMETLLGIDTFITYIFLIDYLLRWWARRFSIPYLFTPIAIIDLIAVLPLFLTETHFQFVRVLRLFRILRLMHLFRNKAFFGQKLTEIHFRLMQIFFTLFCIIFISSGLIYDIEHAHNPHVLGTFFDALYFTIVTLATVGYGDIVPLSTPGRVTTLLMILSGAILIPWQVTNLVRYMIYAGGKNTAECQGCGLQHHEFDAIYCKHCGTRLKS